MQNFEKCSLKLYQEFKDYKANTVDLNEMAHYQLSHLDLQCSQIQQFFTLVHLGEWVQFQGKQVCH